MAYYVCSGAKLKCSMGSKQSELEVVHLTEAFAHMAAEAIVNPMAYENMKNYLPNSEIKFREILIEMLNEELEIWRELWKPALQDRVIVPKY